MLHRLYQKAWSELEAHYQSSVNLPTQIETLVKWNLRVIPLVLLCSQNGFRLAARQKLLPSVLARGSTRNHYSVNSVVEESKATLVQQAAELGARCGLLRLSVL